MKKYLLIILVITQYNSCDKDKPNPNPDPPAVKYCLNAKLDALIQDLKDKTVPDTNFYVKGVFNGVPRTANFICLEDYSFFRNGERQTLNFKLHFHIYKCDSFFMSSYRLLDRYEALNMVNDTFFYNKQIDHSPRILLADDLVKLKNNTFDVDYDYFGLLGEYIMKNNYVTVTKISNDSIVEGNFQFELNNQSLSRKMIVKDGKFRVKVRPNSCNY